MATPLPNVWHLRMVGESSSKSCNICYKPTTAVLITPDNKDFFYVCKSHLSDKGFATPVVDEKVEAEKRKKEEMDREIAKIKQEYDEKQKTKKGKKKSKDDSDKKNDDDDSKAEKERDEKIKAVQAGSKPGGPTEDGPRIFALHRNFYQMRVDRLRNIAQQKISQQRFAQKDLFPSAPKGDIS